MPRNVGTVLLAILAIAAGLEVGRWLTDTNAPPVSGYTEDR